MTGGQEGKRAELKENIRTLKEDIRTGVQEERRTRRGGHEKRKVMIGGQKDWRTELEQDRRTEGQKNRKKDKKNRNAYRFVDKVLYLHEATYGKNNVCVLCVTVLGL
jgi:hypothetical protein